MMDMSVFETLEDSQEKRGWLMTEIQVSSMVTHSHIAVTNLVHRRQLLCWVDVSSSNIQWLDSMLR